MCNEKGCMFDENMKELEKAQEVVLKVMDQAFDRIFGPLVPQKEEKKVISLMTRIDGKTEVKNDGRAEPLRN